MSSRLLALLAITALLAGCAGSPGPTDVDPGTPGTQTETATPFIVTSPGWTVGDWWSHHWTFEGNGPDFTVKTIVAGNDSGVYTFATDSEETAAQHGAFFFMDLGTMGKDGVMMAGDYAFPWYQFPLTNNKTWTASEKNIGDAFEPVTRALTLTAREMGQGSGAHFMVEGRLDGKLSVQYDYQPDLAWFSEFTAFRPDANGTPQAAYTIKNEGQGQGYMGAIYSATGTMLVNEQPIIHPGSTNPPADTVTFTLDAAHTHVFALMFSFGAAGAHATQLVAPDGQHWEAVGVGDADGNPLTPAPLSSGLQLLVPGQAGQWRVDFAGGGVVAGGGCFLWGITITEDSL